MTGVTDLWDAVVQRAETEGLIDVAWTPHDSPIGTLVLAATEEGLVMISYPPTPTPPWTSSPPRCRPGCSPCPAGSTRPGASSMRTSPARWRTFDLDLDMRLMTPFQTLVSGRCARCAFGEVATYQQVARAIGDPPPAGRPVGPTPATRCRSWCRATGWWAPTARSPVTPAAWSARRSCWRWRGRDEDRHAARAVADPWDGRRRHGGGVGRWRRRRPRCRCPLAGGGGAVGAAARRVPRRYLSLLRRSHRPERAGYFPAGRPRAHPRHPLRLHPGLRRAGSRVGRARSGAWRSVAPSSTTRSPSSSPATGWWRPTAASPVTAGDRLTVARSTSSGPCSRSSRAPSSSRCSDPHPCTRRGGGRLRPPSRRGGRGDAPGVGDGGHSAWGSASPVPVGRRDHRTVPFGTARTGSDGRQRQ